MSKRCDLCKRSATKGASRSHSKIKTLKRQGINLQSKTVDGLKLKICTSCMRTLAKRKREAEEKKVATEEKKKAAIEEKKKK